MDELFESVANWVRRNLPHQDEPGVVAALALMDPRTLLILYLNWCERLVHARPREVLLAPGLDMEAVAHNCVDALAVIVSDIRHGNNLYKYLSRRIKIGFDMQSTSAPKNLRKRRHLDLLLTEWGVHHLHLSTELEEDGFVSRRKEGPLLYCVFKSSRAYLLAIMQHDFENDRLLRVMIENWPNEEIIKELVGMRGQRDRQPPTKEQRRALRAAGLSSLTYDYDGRLFAPLVTGMSTAGTSDRASILSGRIVRSLKQFAEQAEHDPEPIKDLIRKHELTPGEKLHFEFTFFESAYGVLETSSGALIGLGDI